MDLTSSQVFKKAPASCATRSSDDDNVHLHAPSCAPHNHVLHMPVS